MNFFNLKRMAALLAVVLATTPVMQVTAASPISQTNAGNIVKNVLSADDITALISAAGIPSGTLATSLQYSFNTSVSKYRYNRNIDIASIVGSYVSAAQAGSLSGATVAAVNNGMQSLMTLMGALLPNYQDNYIDTALKGLSLPLTKAQLSQSAIPSGQDADQYLVNIFVNELAAWVPIQQNAAGNQNNNANNAMLLAAAQQLGLIPATAASMQNLINVAGCNTQPTIQKQINCAISFYNNWVNSTNQLIGQVANVTTNLNQLVATATTTITGYVTSYTSQINAATSTVDVTSAFNAGLAAINAVYPPLIGANGTIEAQNNLATNAENSLKTAVAQIGNVQSTQINATMASLTKAENDFTTAIGQADQAFPQQLPASGLTAATAVNFVTSVPGDAINTLNNAQGAITQPVQTVTANTTALTSALNTISSAMSTDQTNGVNTINASTTIADAQTALNNGVTQVNTDYANLTSANSAYLVALNAAKSTQADLTALQASHAQVADIGTALTTITNAINNANAAAPILPSGTLFTATNAASTYQNTYAGQAIMGMLKAQGNTTQKLTPSNGGGLTSAQIGGIVAGIIAFLIGATIFGLWKAGKWPFTDEGKQSLEDRAKEIGDEISGAKEIDTDLLGKLSDAELALQGPTTALNDLQEALSNVVDELEANPSASQVVSDLNSSSYKILSADAGISAGGEGTFEKLIKEQSGSSIEDQLNAADNLIQDAIPEGSSLTASDIVNLISNPDNLPEGFNGTTTEMVKLVGDTLKASPNIDINNAAGFRAASTAIEDAQTLPANEQSAFDKLASEQTGDVLAQTEAAEKLLDDAIGDTNFNDTDILKFASDSASLPDGFKGTLTDAVNLVGKTLKANSDFTPTTDPATFKAAATDIANLPNISGGPTGIDGQPLSVGGTGQNVPGADAFNGLAAQGKITAAGVKAMLDSGTMDLTTLTAQLNAIKATLEEVIRAGGADSNAAKELQEQIDAGNAAGKAEAEADGNSDGFDPVTVDA